MQCQIIRYSLIANVSLYIGTRKIKIHRLHFSMIWKHPLLSVMMASPTGY